jgi:DNA repair protein RadC
MLRENQRKNRIKNLPKTERPREKLIAKGPQNFYD